MNNRITLSRDIYDALEFAAETVGGVGRGSYYDYHSERDENGNSPPWCIYGLADEAQGDDPSYPISLALADAGVTFADNDAVVGRYITAESKKGRHVSRMPFQLWAQKMNVIRGEY